MKSRLSKSANTAGLSCRLCIGETDSNMPVNLVHPFCAIPTQLPQVFASFNRYITGVLGRTSATNTNTNVCYPSQKPTVVFLCVEPGTPVRLVSLSGINQSFTSTKQCVVLQPFHLRGALTHTSNLQFLETNVSLPLLLK